MVVGSNDISGAGLRGLRGDLGRLSKVRGRVLWVETPHRFDRNNENSLIDEQNNIIKEVCKVNRWNFLNINSILDRNCFTRHGLHMNVLGKDLLCSLIGNFFNNMGQSSRGENFPKNVGEVWEKGNH
jgi:hypothetical protein